MRFPKFTDARTFPILLMCFGEEMNYLRKIKTNDLFFTLRNCFFEAKFTFFII